LGVKVVQSSVPQVMRRTFRVGRKIAWVYLLLLCAAVGLQIHGGAYSAEFAEDPDEPAHYVTGLMVRDYIAQGPYVPPMQFAQDYYAHYPKVAFGWWPPVFYMIQAGWTLIFTSGRTSLLLLLAALTSLLALSIFCILRRHLPAGGALAAALVFLSLPAVQQYGRMVMAEIPASLLMMWATMACARFVRTRRIRDAAIFGLLTSTAILTQYTSIALAAVPVALIFLLRRFELLRQPAIWVSLLIIVGICAPWYSFSPNRRHRTIVETTIPGLIDAPGTRIANVHTAFRPWTQDGTMLLFFVGGAALLIRRIRRTMLPDPAVIACTGVPAGVALCALVIPGWGPRYMFPATPFIIVLAAIGLKAVAEKFKRPNAAAVIAAIAIAGMITVNISRTPPKPRLGARQLARDLIESKSPPSPVILVSSDPIGEGAVVSEIAMADTRPHWIVLRASKMLASDDWMGRNYELRLHTPAEVREFLDRSRVHAVVLDRFPRVHSAHHRLVEQAVSTEPWERMSSYVSHRPQGTSEMVVFRAKTPPRTAPATIEIDLGNKIDRTIRYPD
jgi:hypothetical protein